jgi:hypothetical protein
MLVFAKLKVWRRRARERELGGLGGLGALTRSRERVRAVSTCDSILADYKIWVAN